MKLVVLGSTGMLGHAVTKFMNPCVEIISVSRENFDVLKDDLNQIPKGDLIINCIGVIKQNNPTKRELEQINTKFPHDLSAFAKKRNSKLIHVSTDCVFDGKTGNYTEDSFPCADDDYGKSKLLGEPEDCMVIRTSLIGREIRGKCSLLEWFLSQSEEVRGFENHFWNGITTQEFTKCLQKIIDDGLYADGVHHVFSTKVSKYEMLEAFNVKFEKEIYVKRFRDSNDIDRSLSTVKTLNNDLKILSFSDMIREMI